MTRAWPFLGTLHLLALLVIATEVQMAVGFCLASLALSFVAFILYAWDKSAARANGRRIPERRLHILALVGGWPGAALAGAMLRHKTQKRAFGRAFACAVVANVVVTYGTLLLIAQRG